MALSNATRWHSCAGIPVLIGLTFIAATAGPVPAGQCSSTHCMYLAVPYPEIYTAVNHGPFGDFANSHRIQFGDKDTGEHCAGLGEGDDHDMVDGCTCAALHQVEGLASSQSFGSDEAGWKGFGFDFGGPGYVRSLWTVNDKALPTAPAGSSDDAAVVHEQITLCPE